MDLSRLVWVTVGKTEHQAWLMGDLDSPTPEGYVLIRWESTRDQEYVPTSSIRADTFSRRRRTTVPKPLEETKERSSSNRRSGRSTTARSSRGFDSATSNRHQGDRKRSRVSRIALAPSGFDSSGMTKNGKAKRLSEHEAPVMSGLKDNTNDHALPPTTESSQPRSDSEIVVSTMETTKDVDQVQKDRPVEIIIQCQVQARAPEEEPEEVPELTSTQQQVFDELLTGSRTATSSGEHQYSHDNQCKPRWKRPCRKRVIDRVPCSESEDEEEGVVSSDDDSSANSNSDEEERKGKGCESDSNSSIPTLETDKNQFGSDWKSLNTPESAIAKRRRSIGFSPDAIVSMKKSLRDDVIQMLTNLRNDRASKNLNLLASVVGSPNDVDI